MFSRALIASLALVPFAVAQTSSVDIAAIEAHFEQSALVPDLFPSFTPSALLTLDYPGVGEAEPGQLFTKEQVGPTPTVTVVPANSSVSLSGTYTLAMVDADIVGSKLPEGQTRHWLVNGVTISGSTVNNASAVGITTYAGPWPAAGSGPHRQVPFPPSTFSAPAAFSQPNMGVSVFDFNAYVRDSGLGPLIAANYITVEEGTATASIPATSAVVTSTLAAGSSASSSSGSSTGTSDASSPTTSTSGAAALSAKLLSAMVAAGLAILVV
ncbi:hypothetical protein NLJ89_g7715 [Agrocybe chaxingu]|uniref:Uncharacterized protein n=1 Tax=Agrocybe chaxingu TaxID=84603 RepID=A0A9W8MRH2_9AGAR|nr:hypothetical protein NLJ89_g7715 [Agrocybe chaxingu]